MRDWFENRKFRIITAALGIFLLFAAVVPNKVSSAVPASGNTRPFTNLDCDESDDQVSATYGSVFGWAITNNAGTVRWVKFYDATAANTTVGTTTPVITFGIPGNTTVTSANMMGGVGIQFFTAITTACTTGFAVADTGAPGANDVILNIFYKN